MDKKESWIFNNYEFINSILKPENRLGLDIFENLQSNIDIISTNIMLDSIDSLGNISSLTKKKRKYHYSIIEFLDLYMPEFFETFKDAVLMNYYINLYNSERNKLDNKKSIKKIYKFKKTKSK